MSTMFSCVRAAQEFVAVGAGRDPETVIFEEVEDLRAGGLELELLDDPAVSEDIKKSIREKLAAQQGFKFTNCNGAEVKIVIGPFRDGYDCWLVGLDGLAFRL